MPSSGDLPHEDAVLVLDTRAEAGRLRLRDLGCLERRLLFRAARAHIEIRVGAPPSDPDEPVWLFGQYVATRRTEDEPVEPERPVAPHSRPRIAVVLVGPSGPAEETQVGSAGDFALPCDPKRPFWLEFHGDGPSRIRTRLEP